MVSTKREAEAVADALKEAKVPATIIGPDERDQPNSTSVRVATMHRAKGLEFDEVVLLVTAQAGQQPTAFSDQRRLQYVAITRAKKLATVIRVG
jgi:superfamily I DNA/RNA helicase